MPSKSQASQRFFNFVHAVQKGKASARGYDKVQDAANEMKPTSVEHFMGRGHIDKSLPKRAKCACGQCAECITHSDVKEDTRLIKKLVKSDALKKEAFLRGFWKAAANHGNQQKSCLQ